MMPLQLLIDQNNLTVALVRQQDFPNAVVSSTVAMTIVQELQEFSADGTCVLDCLDQCMLLSNVSTVNETDPYQDDTVFVYNRGIVIPSRTTMPYEVVSSILIFNSALAHQLYAQQQQQGTTTFQQYVLRSKRLYELALEGYSDVDHNVLFQFAVMNNIALIELVTGHVALSTEYFEHLLSTLMLLLDRGCTSRLHHLRGFLRNVQFQLAAASAA